MKTRETEQRAEQKKTSDSSSLLKYTREQSQYNSESSLAESERVMSIVKAVSVSATAIKEKLAKYAKLSFNESSHHDAEFDRASYTDDKKDFIVSDKKYYKSVERVDTLTMTRAEVEQRLSKVALFDRDAFVSAFEYEATFILCCNSKAVSHNLAHHERQYSTLYRHLALYAHRSDLYLMSMMSDKQREQAFNSSYFLKAVEIQAKALDIATIQKATTSNKRYEKAVEQLKKLLIATKTAKTTATEKTATAKLIKAKAVSKKATATAKK